MPLTGLGPVLWREDKLDGTPANGYLVYFYAAGTSTPQDTYNNPDGALAHKNLNPVQLDARGAALIFMQPLAYRVVLTDALGGVIYDVPSYSPYQAVGGGSGLDESVTFGENVAANDFCIVSDGSGGRVAGRAYRADADDPQLSVLPIKSGFATSATTAGVSGFLRTTGSIDGFVGLTPGSSYYASSVAGQITATKPADARLAGIAISSTTLSITPVVPVLADIGVNGFRLSLTTGAPVTTADVTGAGAVTVFAVPYKGTIIGLADSAGVVSLVSSAQVSVNLPAVANQMYDVFGYNNAGVFTLELLAWTNDTTRATALVLTTTGFLTKSGDLTRRYLGSVRTGTVAGQSEDSFAKRLLDNYYHRLTRPMRAATETADSWTYSTNAWRQANANAANQLAFVIGVAERPVLIEANGAYGANGADHVSVGIGLDSTTALATGTLFETANALNSAGALTQSLRAVLRTFPAVGFHFAAWLERDWTAASTVTWFGDDGGDTQSGISGELS